MGTGYGLILAISIILNIFLYLKNRKIKKEEIVEIQKVKEENKFNNVSSVTVKEIMTPRTSIYAIDKKTTLKENLKEIIEQGFSRIPIYNETIDDICGILYTKDILGANLNRKVEAYIKKAIYVPETMNISKLFEEFRLKQNHMAIIIDEYGCTAGIVTIEDILEEFVGEIRDEYDIETDNIVKISENIYDILGETTVDEIDEQIKVNIPLSEEYETISGFVQYKLGKVAEENDQLKEQNYIIKIMKVENKRIIKLRMILLKVEGEENE
ncbi:hemolysin family protein [Sneathia sanguinegens]|uniref:Hemolysin family protein n=1 Tax=Sneathia sanguinegens TaxID=40543 RepID=A0ABT7HJS6_9FUSO|nr:hemolysin family protein [Sneathia sanguinegens]MDK9580768.1 hemolysin family protein [Sneathia sanguinegens]